jgi:hypothetical protein
MGEATGVRAPSLHARVAMAVPSLRHVRPRPDAARVRRRALPPQLKPSIAQ